MTDIQIYKAKEVGNNKWIYGFPYIIETNSKEKKTFLIPVYASTLYGVPVISESLSLCSSFTDKNKTPLCDGDIVCLKTLDADEIVYANICYGEFEDSNGSDDVQYGWYIVFYHGKKEIKVSLLNGKTDGLLAISLAEFMGNKFDNPELTNKVKGTTEKIYNV